MRSSLPEAPQDHFQHECFGPKKQRQQIANGDCKNTKRTKAEQESARLYFVPAKLKG
jgi:hypothetical protein